MEIALCEITYYPNWYNIKHRKKYNLFIDGQQIPIPKGYYNICDLNEVFKPHGVILDLHTPTGFLRLKNNNAQKKVELSYPLALLLGFKSEKDDNWGVLRPGQTSIAAQHSLLIVHKALCVHLEEISTYENLYNGKPSTLLRSVAVGNEQCGGGKTITFTTPQYKKLMNGDISQLRLRITNERGEQLNIEHLYVTLHIRNG